MNRPVPKLSTRLALGLAATALLAFAGCGDRREVAVHVNKEGIPAQWVDAILQQRGVKPEQADAAGRAVVERLINEQLALQKAADLKLDREPRVQQLMELARREILARAYAEKVGEAAVKPTPAEVQAFYEAKPALYAQRRVYNIQELLIECKPEQVTMLREKLAAAANVNEFLEYLRANDFRYQGSQAVRAAEQLPPAALEGFARMKDGNAAVMASANGAQVLVLAGSRDQPLTLDQARPAIEQRLLAERKLKLIEDDLKAMRASAKIEYAPKYAPSAASAPPAPASAPASGGN